MKKVPTCVRCGKQHYNMHPCSSVQPPPDYLRTQPAPEGFRFSGEWGVKTKSVPLVYTLPPQPRHGRVIGPDGSTYTPSPPAAA